MNLTNTSILDFTQINAAMIPLVGGKGANLGELCAIPGVQVPAGFCVSTAVYQSLLQHHAPLQTLLDELDQLKITDRKRIAATSAEIRETIATITIPEDVKWDISDHVAKMGAHKAFAIRSSATAEDLPDASFAGQQDSYLNITGINAILQHIRLCWASLYTERAVVYRMQHGFDHRKVQLAVVVQEMVFPEASGIVFTANPANANRRELCIDAGFGLGEALVGGLVNADHYRVRDGVIIDKKIAAKQLAIYAAPAGGTTQQPLDETQQQEPALTDRQVLQLEQLGRKIEAHFGSPQDIEWCLAQGQWYIVQSRPITTLYPIPETDDAAPHVYVSVGHNQMMTDAMKPLGLSFFLLITRAPMHPAGGRLFVDITQSLGTVSGRAALLSTVGKSDPLIKDALQTVMQRELVPLVHAEGSTQPTKNKYVSVEDLKTPETVDPAIVQELIASSQAAIAALQQDMQNESGMGWFESILADVQQLRAGMFDPRSMSALMAGFNASAWVNEKMSEWLGEKNAADVLSQSAPDNVTSEMGLALLDVSDAIRPYPEVIQYLQEGKNQSFEKVLMQLQGGKPALEAITGFLDRYGMRCVGEIDITRPRWSEKPSTLFPLILSNIQNFEAGEAGRKFEKGLQEALAQEQDLLTRLRQLPDGEQKAADTQRMIAQMRSFMGYREYPKYSIVNHFYQYKLGLKQAAVQLVMAGVIGVETDIDYLSFDELYEVFRTQKLDSQLIAERKVTFQRFEKLTPPRVITSEGEIITGRYQHEQLPDGALAGLAVSSGIIEGRARVIPNLEAANLEAGDILVTTFTDPSWTPLFVFIKGLVTEVGGLMTHGAVIAREYGLPAVVGVEQATKRIKDGQRIRVNGTEGYVELLDEG